MTSRVNRQIVQDWAAVAVSKDPPKLRDLQNADAIPEHIKTDLAILCGHLGRLCAICDNRAKLPLEENMSELQLCRACESAYFLRVSHFKIMERYKVSKSIPGNPSMEQLLDMFGCTSLKIKGEVYYNMDDFWSIKVLKPPVLDTLRDPWAQWLINQSYTNEDFGDCYPPKQKAKPILPSPQKFILDEICLLEGLDRKQQDSISPWKLEMLLLNYFRLLYDLK